MHDLVPDADLRDSNRLQAQTKKKTQINVNTACAPHALLRVPFPRYMGCTDSLSRDLCSQLRRTYHEVLFSKLVKIVQTPLSRKEPAHVSWTD
eukprot:3642791-Rhodomonas_salina.2